MGSWLRVTNGFVFCAVFVGGSAGRRVSEAPIEYVPPPPPPAPDLVAYFDAPVTHPGTGWAIAAGLGVALAYFLSILLHELGHFLTARVLRVRVAGVQLDFAGGFVTIEDETTPGRAAAIIAAGPLVSGALAVGAWAALRALGWPLLGIPYEPAGAAIAAGATLSYVFLLNAVAFVLNLLPFPSFDGGKLLLTTRFFRELS
jgi:Zn-dependent protease